MKNFCYLFRSPSFYRARVKELEATMEWGQNKKKYSILLEKPVKKKIWRTQKEEWANIKVNFKKVTCQTERQIELVWTVLYGLGY